MPDRAVPRGRVAPDRLSMSRVSPTQRAPATITGRSTRSTGWKLSGSTTSRYSSLKLRILSESVLPHAARRSRRPSTPESIASLGGAQRARTEQWRAAARARIEALVARAQRQAVGFAHRRHADDASPARRSRATMRRMIASCCASFSPKYAPSGWTICSSFITTVATPRKCPGR